MSDGANVKSFLVTCWPHLKINYWVIPKCGSTSVLAALLHSRGDQNVDSLSDVEVHDKRVQYITHDQAQQNGYQNITLVRDPYQRAISLYKDFGLRRNHKRMIKSKSIDRNQSNNIDYFFQYQIAPSNDLLDDLHVRSQCSYITDDQNIFRVDKIYRMEMIDQMWRNLDLYPVQRNQTPEQIQLNSQQKLIIYTRYRRDFELLGYTQ